MNLLFFGSSNRQLFGAYHAPPSTVLGRGAAVLCPPWGSEYLASHRILRRLAMRLSECGYHVLRFDYYGTGDSSGGREDGDLDSWCVDASLAVDELRDMSGCPSVASFGIRLGAAVGWRLSRMRPDVHTVVMWDPVLSGSEYVQELIVRQRDIDRGSVSSVKRTPQASSGHLDLLGFPLVHTMRQSIERLSPDEFGQPTKAQVTVFYSEPPAGHERLHQAFETAGTRYRVETVLGQPPWREAKTILTGGTPFVVVDRMVEMLP